MMNKKSISGILTCALLVVSCDKQDTTINTSEPENAAEQVSVAKPSNESAEQDGRPFTHWISKAELQFRMENLSQGEYYSVIEGRCVEGANQYRAIISQFDAEKYHEWAVFWGLTEKELFDYEIALLRLGFQRSNSQVFVDEAGVAHHQIVMLRPLGVGTPLAGKNGQAGSADGNNVGVETPIQSTAKKPEPPVQVLPSKAQVVDVDDETPKNIEQPAKKPAIIVDKKPDTSQSSNTSRARKSVEPTRIISHVVSKGDTLMSISRRYEISVSDIKKANGLSGDMIRIKQVLKIPRR